MLVELGPTLQKKKRMIRFQNLQKIWTVSQWTRSKSWWGPAVICLLECNSLAKIQFPCTMQKLCSSIYCSESTTLEVLPVLGDPIAQDHRVERRQ